MAIKMPVQETVVCVSCDSVQEVMWSEYGAIAPCIDCDGAPVYLVKACDL